MTKGKKIVVVGSCMIDFVCYAPRLPLEGETIHGTSFCTNFGGKGGNQCVAAAKLGGKTTFVARVGDDIWGDKYLANLKQLNVDTEHVAKTQGYGNGIAQITVAENGANQIVIVAGANSRLSCEDVAKAEEVVSNADVVVCQLETSIDVAVESFKLCQGISILNGAPAINNAPDELYKLPTIFCVNESEAAIFSGVQVSNITDAKIAIKVLLSKGCKSVILTMGSEGAVYGCAEKPDEFHHVPCPKVKCVDSTGAGDAFIGALAFLLTADMSIVEAMGKACIIASDSVTRAGTQISYAGMDILNRI